MEITDFDERKVLSEDNERNFSAQTIEKVQRGFCVDDCVTPTPTVESAKRLVHKLSSSFSKERVLLELVN